MHAVEESSTPVGHMDGNVDEQEQREDEWTHTVWTEAAHHVLVLTHILIWRNMMYTYT